MFSSLPSLLSVSYQGTVTDFTEWPFWCLLKWSMWSLLFITLVYHADWFSSDELILSSFDESHLVITSLDLANVLKLQSHFLPANWAVGNICKLCPYTLGIVPAALSAFFFHLPSDFTRDYHSHLQMRKTRPLKVMWFAHCWWVGDLRCLRVCYSNDSLRLSELMGFLR